MPNNLDVLLRLSCCATLLVAAVSASADESTESRPQGFEADVLPVLREHCLKCHGEKSRKGGLSLRTISGIVRGGESGEPIVVAGEAEKSRLIELVKAGEMPPGAARLSDTEVQVLEHWINTAARQELATVDEALSPELLAARSVHFLFEVKCQPCHGRAKQEGGLDMRAMASILKGGKSGPALVRGKAAESLLLRRIHDDQMPPRDVRYKLSIRPVSEAEQELIRQWIDAGAIDPPPPPAEIDDDGLLVSEEDRQWWAFQSPVAAAIPSVTDRHQVRTPIDSFLLKELEAKGLNFSAEADRRTLIRRACVDLLGVTPAQEETQAYIDDIRPNAFERLIDRLLASPRYGERWGQHWLDAAGYADSEGSASADTVYPLVYQYRDYVIRAMNADKPYDRFLLEQLAGDELTDYRTVPRMTPELRDNLIATGYLRTCIDPTTSPETNFLHDRYQVLADTVEIVSSSLLGLTMRCARCHSHKYDPLPQRDYYRFTAIFAPAYTVHDWVKPQQRTIELAGVEDRREIAEFNATINNQIHPINLKIAELNEQDADFQEQKEKLEADKKQLEAQLRSPPQAQGLTDMRPEAEPFYLLQRGEWNNRGRRVLPNVPAVLKRSIDAFQVTKPFADAPTTGSRLAFANWLTHDDHPLTARVMVNRAWQHHFGQGIVPTAEDFGKTGVAPTHPQLLDWLAVEFVQSGWSVKHLHRLIMTSSAWRQQARVRDEAAAVDPENRLWWRMTLRRMDAEVVRDSMLAVAGKLDGKMFGAAVGVENLPDGQVITTDSAEGNRRSVYLLHRRSTPVTVLETFDAPRLTTNCIQRRTSNVVSQALLMLNSGFADQQADDLAKRVALQTDDQQQKIAAAYSAVLGRQPTARESALAHDFLGQQSERYNVLNEAKDVHNGALVDLCLVLLNSAEFLYVD
ncbi:MAG: PSD1 and planctomycete cytochrome C domain-containing protein [Planctomycetota bacterium]|nr:PSD1 and planctomycete cytochrome C domain-containing protein [Planctomycetota bacterium]